MELNKEFWLQHSRCAMLLSQERAASERNKAGALMERTMKLLWKADITALGRELLSKKWDEIGCHRHLQKH
jgi:hypothetical protein